jgi:ferredoxin
MSTSPIKLKRSRDRKVTNLATANGKQAKILNTFGLPAGKQYSCPGMTDTCEKVCYAGKIEKIFPSVRKLLLHNWNLLQGKTAGQMFYLLDEMIMEFKNDCDKYGAEKYFRIHWDGDFYSREYTMAWKIAIRQHSDVQFWVYTRVAEAAELLQNHDNLSLYFSADRDNVQEAKRMHNDFGIRLAWLDETFESGERRLLEITGKPGAKCPEQTRQLEMITKSGGACYTCGLCTQNKANIRFAISKA